MPEEVPAVPEQDLKPKIEEAARLRDLKKDEKDNDETM